MIRMLVKLLKIDVHGHLKLKMKMLLNQVNVFLKHVLQIFKQMVIAQAFMIGIKNPYFVTLKMDNAKR